MPRICEVIDEEIARPAESSAAELMRLPVDRRCIDVCRMAAKSCRNAAVLHFDGSTVPGDSEGPVELLGRAGAGRRACCGRVHPPARARKKVAAGIAALTCVLQLYGGKLPDGG
jgi:hypothetical protein